MIIKQKAIRKLTTAAIFAAAFAFTISAAFAPAVLAADFQGGQMQNGKMQGDLEIPATSTSRNLYTAAMHVTVDASTVKDLTAAGKTVIINGNVGDDLLAAAQTLNIKGTVGGSARIAGSSIDITSPSINEDLLAAATDLDIETTTTIKGDLIAAVGTAVINGDVDGNAKISGGTITINGKVAGDLDVRSSNTLELGPNAQILGNINYSAPQQLVQDQGSSVGGQINFAQTSQGSFFPAITWLLLVKLLAAILAAIVLFALFKRRFVALAMQVGNRFWKNAGIGFVGLIIVPVVIAILLLIFIGYYLALMLLAWYLLALMLSLLVGSVYFGSWLIAKIDRKEMKIDYLTVIVGIVVVGVLRYIPIAGWLLMAVIAFAGFGALLRTFNQERKS